MAETTGDLYEQGRALRILATVDPDADDAEQCLVRAEEILRRIGAKLEYGLAIAARIEISRAPTRASLVGLEKAAVIFRACGAHAARARTLCALASAFIDTGECEKALASLGDAEAVLGRDGGLLHVKKDMEAVRARIDDSLSRLLVSPECDKAASSEDVHRLLSTRLGAAGLVVARCGGDGGDLEPVEIHGLTADVAENLLRIAAARSSRPLVMTCLRDSAAAGTAPGIRSLLGVEFGGGAGRWLGLVCWTAGGRRDGGPDGMSRLVEAYHELMTLGPILERTCIAEPAGLLPICLGGILTRDGRLTDLLLSLPKVARTRASVLIAGETGTGKELVARAIHALSPRSRGPFVVQNCAALPEHLLESELFGHRAGAFTDARTDKQGLLEAASGGTFFLDEIGDVSPAIQAKMLGAIEGGEVRRLGETRPRLVDVRFVAATNKRLEEEVERGRFRRDLYYRLNVVSLVCPPLRERKGDIDLLSRLFLGRFARAAGRRGVMLDEGAAGLLRRHAWPGNVRELENEIERAVAMLGQRDELTAARLSASVAGACRERAPGGLRDEIRSVERARILAALRRYDWNKTHTARALGGLSRPALVAKMKRLGIPLAKPDAGRG
jgi:transcriptional regulator with AAA-type ATPase domain